MQKVKLDDIAEIFSGLSYRRYLDDNGEKFKGQSKRTESCQTLKNYH